MSTNSRSGTIYVPPMFATLALVILVLSGLGCSTANATLTMDEFVRANDRAEDGGFFHVPDGYVLPYRKVRIRFILEDGYSPWLRPARHFQHFDGRVYHVEKGDHVYEFHVEEMLGVSMRWKSESARTFGAGVGALVGVLFLALRGLAGLGGLGRL